MNETFSEISEDALRALAGHIADENAYKAGAWRTAFSALQTCCQQDLEPNNAKLALLVDELNLRRLLRLQGALAAHGLYWDSVRNAVARLRDDAGITYVPVSKTSWYEEYASPTDLRENPGTVRKPNLHSYPLDPVPCLSLATAERPKLGREEHITFVARTMIPYVLAEAFELGPMYKLTVSSAQFKRLCSTYALKPDKSYAQLSGGKELLPKP